MRPDLLALTREGERLREVRMFAPEVHPEAVCAILLKFDATTLILIANEDDTLSWGSTDDLSEFPLEVEAVAWNQFLSRAPLYFWELTNHKGYSDGFQIEFYFRTGVVNSVQLMVEASQFFTYLLYDLDREGRILLLENRH